MAKFKNEVLEFDLTSLEKYIKRFPDKVVDRMLQLVGIDLTRNVKIEAPVDEGVLRGSVELPKRVRALLWHIVIKARYWRPVQFGRKKIVPVRAKVLRFEIKGRIVFARFARAVKPNDFIGRAIEETSKRLDDFATIAVKESQ